MNLAELFLPLVRIIVVSLMVKVALDGIFLLPLYEKYIKGWLKVILPGEHPKRYISLAVNITVVFQFPEHMDMVAILLTAQSHWLTLLLTGLVNSGGAEYWAKIFTHADEMRALRRGNNKG